MRTTTICGRARDRRVSSATPHALLWLSGGKSPHGEDVHPIVGLVIAARAMTREIRVVFIFRATIGEFRFLRRIW